MHHASGMPNQKRAIEIALKMAMNHDISDIEWLVREQTDVSEHEKLYRAVDSQYTATDKWLSAVNKKLEKIVGKEHQQLITDYDDAHVYLCAARENAAFYLGFAVAIQLFTLKPAGRKLTKATKRAG